VARQIRSADPLHLGSDTADQRRYEQHRRYQDRHSMKQAQRFHSADQKFLVLHAVLGILRSGRIEYDE
jgi:hypothetical protein